MSRGSHRTKRRPNRLGNGLGRPAHGPSQPAYPLSGPPQSHLSRVDSSHLLQFMSFTIAPLCTSLSWRYLRGKDRIGNPSLNFHLLCLIPKYLDLIFVGLVLWALCAWMGFESTWALVLPLGFGLRLSPCWRSITGLVISCSKIGQKAAKTKFLQNICASVKMTNN